MKSAKLLSELIIVAFLMLSFKTTNDWILFQTKGCEIYFPKKPTDQSQTVKTSIGEIKIDIYMYEVPDNEADDNHIYGLMINDYPDSLINSDKKDLLDHFFRNAVDGAVKNVQGKLLSESKIQLEGYPGREFRIDFKDGLAVIRMRVILVKNKMFMLQTIAETKKDANKSSERFMNSFKLRN